MQRLLTILFFSLILLFLFVGYFHPLAAFDQDLGRHLLTGKIILTTGQIPSTNFYSYTHPDFPFLNHHYGSEVVLYGVHTFLGNTGLIGLMLLLVISAFGLLLWYGYKQGYSLIILAITSLLYLPILFERTDIRPELFGYLFLSVCMVLLLLNRHKPTKLLYVLPLMQLIWAQLHISFIIGLVVITLFLLDVCVVHHKNLRVKPVKNLLILLSLCSIASLLTPFGIEGALYPLRIFQNYGYTIEENQNIFFLASIMQKLSIPYFQATVVLLFILLFSHYKKSRPIDWLLALTFTYLATSAVRHFPLFVFATFLSFAYYLTLTHKKLASLLLPTTRIHTRYIITFLLLLLLLWQIVTTMQRKGFGVSIEESAKPAADFYIQKNINGPVFNNFDIGSYLAYRLYPKQRIFVDGRPEAYPAAFFQETYIPMQQDVATFTQVDQQYNFNAIFFMHTDQTPWGEAFLKQIVRNAQWKIVYFDSSVIILVKAMPQNEQLLQHTLPLATLAQVPTNTSMNDLLRRAHFFAAANLISQSLPTFEAILKKDPHHCPALYYLAQIQPESAYPQQLQRFCK